MGFLGGAFERGLRGVVTAGVLLVVLVASCSDGSSVEGTTTQLPHVDSSTSTTPIDATTRATAAVSDSAAPCPATEPRPATESDWATYGFDDAISRHNPAETRIGPGNVWCLEVLWSIDDLSGVTGTPIVIDGIVYFGDWNGMLHAVDADTGDLAWEEQVSQGAITATALVTDERIFVSDSDGFMYARDRATGSAVWTVEVDAQPAAGIVAAPVLVDDTLIVGVAGNNPFDVDYRGSIVALDAATGVELWRIETTDETTGTGGGVWTTGALDRDLGLAFFGTGNIWGTPVSPLSDALLAIDYERGEISWKHQLNPEDTDDADVGATPNLFTIDGRVVVGVGGKIGQFRVVDRQTGDEVWSTELTTGGNCCGVYATSALGDGVIYVNSIPRPGATSITFALDSRDGSILWQQPIPSAVYGSLTLANGVVLHGSVAGRVYALDARDGTILWSEKLPGNFGDGISVAGGTLFVGYGFSIDLTGVRDGGIVAYSLP